MGYVVRWKWDVLACDLPKHDTVYVMNRHNTIRLKESLIRHNFHGKTLFLVDKHYTSYNTTLFMMIFNIT